MIQIPNLNSIDLIVLFLLLTTSLIGLKNGFIKEFLNLFMWTLSILFSLLVINELIISNNSFRCIFNDNIFNFIFI